MFKLFSSIMDTYEDFPFVGWLICGFLLLSIGFVLFSVATIIIDVVLAKMV